MTAAYKADTYDKKVNLGVGAYRDDESKPWVLPVVKKVCILIRILRVLELSYIFQATQILLSAPNLDHEYLPILGLAEYTSKASSLILGSDSPAIHGDRVSSVQTISGTGANHLGALFLERFYGWGTNKKEVYLSNPTWGALHSSLFYV